jgi:hypothetical protein
MFDGAEAYPDELSGCTIPPGEVKPIRVFDTAEDAMQFLALRYRARFTPKRHRRLNSVDV